MQLAEQVTVKMFGKIQPAKQATAYNLGWSEALRAEPQVIYKKTFQPAKAGGSMLGAVARFTG